MLIDVSKDGCYVVLLYVKIYNELKDFLSEVKKKNILE